MHYDLMGGFGFGLLKEYFHGRPEALLRTGASGVVALRFSSTATRLVVRFILNLFHYLSMNPVDLFLICP